MELLEIAVSYICQTHNAEIDLQELDSIFQQPYEKRKLSDKGIIFVGENDVELKRFCDKEFDYENKRELRKILELASVSAKAHQIYIAVVRKNGRASMQGVIIDPSDAYMNNKYCIMLKSQGNWEIKYGDRWICAYRENHYQSFRENAFEKLEKNINHYSGYNEITELIKDLSKHINHGAIFVCFAEREEAEKKINEASSLKRAYKFKYTLDMHSLDEVVISSFANIDGAIIIDKQGICYGIGTILDGKAKEEGDASRGSRFNSSLTYSANLKEEGIEAAIYVISEDGGIDFIVS